MATRREAVVLELKDQFSAPAIRAAASARLLQGSLDNTSGSADRVSPSMGRAEQAIGNTGTTARRSGTDINQFSGRLGLLVQAATSVAPAFAPIGTVAVPALTGLSNAVGVTALAVGTGVLAFQGLADALKAMDKASLDPTTAHLDDARAKLEALSAPAKKFAEDIGAVMPVLEQLRLAAGVDLFPGLSNLIDGGVSEFPRIQALLESVGGAIGNLGTMTGESLQSGQWGDFLEFLQVEAPRSIESLGRSLASLTGGLSELWMAFQPTNNDFNAWLEDTAQQFQDWSAGLSATDGFKEFVDYINQSGPQVSAALGAIGNAVLQISEAVSPLGGPTLEIITTLADALAGIADSPLGTPLAALATMVSTLSLLNKGLNSTRGLLGGLTLAGGDGGAGESAGIGAFFSDNADQIREAAGSIRQNVGTIGAVMGTAGARTDRESARLRASFRGIATGAGQMGLAVGRTAAPMAGLALAATDVDEKLGISNAAMLGLTGSMAGPLGAAVGASVGLFLDFSAAGKEATDALGGLNSAAASGNIDLLNQKIRDAKKELTDYNDIAGGKFGVGNTFRRIGTDVSNVFGGKFSDQTDEYQKSIDVAEQQATSLRELNKIAAESAPAMQALGISFNDLAQAQALAVVDPTQYAALLGSIQEFQAGAGTARAKADALAASMANMGDQMLPPAERAKQLKDALDALLSPQLNLADATDQYQDGLRNISESLTKNNRELVGNTDAAAQNRDAIRTQVRNLQALVSAQADSGASGAKLAGTMRKGRQDILNAGAAAGISRKQMRDYLNTLGLTPKSIETIVKAQTQGALAALNAIRSYVIPDKSFTVTQYTNARLADAKVTGGTKRKAEGGSVPKDGGAYADRYLYMLAPGEEVISNRYGQADRFRADRAAGRIPGYATGGTVGDEPDDEKKPPTASQRKAAAKRAASAARARRRANNALDDLGVNLSIDADGASHSLEKFTEDLENVRGLFKDAHLAFNSGLKKSTKAISENAKKYDGLTTALAGLRADKASFAGEVGSSLGGSLFGNGLAGFQTAADANAADYRAANAGLAAAIANGLDGPLRDALATSGDINALSQFGNLSASQIQDEENRYAALQAAQSQFGSTAASAKYDSAIAKNTADMAKEVAALRRDVKDLDKRVEAGAERGTRRGSHDGAESGTNKANQGQNTTTTQNAQTAKRGGGNRNRRGR